MVDDIGPQRGPASVQQVAAQAKQVAEQVLADYREARIDVLEAQLASAEEAMDALKVHASVRERHRLAAENAAMREALTKLFYRHPQHPPLTNGEYDMIRPLIERK